mmetsp:Transcript_27073/g.55387  ORF Transcript_27073/g.55387 Transcript_27073/m.55387 type:complete len:254 (-) Transcript_27073:212-973(-)
MKGVVIRTTRGTQQLRLVSRSGIWCVRHKRREAFLPLLFTLRRDELLVWVRSKKLVTWAAIHRQRQQQQQQQQQQVVQQFTNTQPDIQEDGHKQGSKDKDKVKEEEAARQDTAQAEPTECREDNSRGDGQGFQNMMVATATTTKSASDLKSGGDDERVDVVNSSCGGKKKEKRKRGGPLVRGLMPEARVTELEELVLDFLKKRYPEQEHQQQNHSEQDRVSCGDVVAAAAAAAGHADFVAGAVIERAPTQKSA